jgi:Bacteriophage tail sheath protein
MPVQPTYPGVYIEEVPSGVRTITGVATSITAFLGRTKSGPVNEPVTINSYGDFERTFGGLWAESSLGYAVRDFYLNGGGQAIIVRLFHPFFASDQEQADAAAAAQAVATAAATEAANSGDEVAVAAAARTAADNIINSATASEAEKDAADFVAKAAKKAAVPNATGAAVSKAAQDAVGTAAPVNAGLTVDSLELQAASAGSWGNQLKAEVDHDVIETDLFNLTVRLGSAGPVEVFRNLSVESTHPRRVDKVLAAESKLVRARSLPGSTPAEDAGQVSETVSDGSFLETIDIEGSKSNKQGLYALEKTDLFNLLCIPPYTATGDIDLSVIDTVAAYCEKRRAMLIMDPPSTWKSKDNAKNGVGSIGTPSKNAALFFPRLVQPNPLRDNQMEEFVPCGAVAGVFARTDAQRGVWKAPAGLDATLVGVPALSVSLTDPENGELNPLGVNCLRVRVPVGPVIWGARTRQGDDRLASEWKYIPVRRLALYIEESLYRGTQWVVFEPNDEPLWSQIRLNLGAFMNTLFRQGAFQGKTPREAYLVKCDKETTTQDDINRGVVNILVGFAPLKPAEFVIIRIQQLAGQIQT